MDVSEVFNLALSSLTNPRKTANNLVKKKLGLGDGVLAVVLGALVPAVIGAIAVLMVLTALAAMVSWIPMMGGLGLLGAGVGIVTAVAILIAVPIAVTIAWLIESVIIWVVAGALGGKGDFAKFASAWAFPMAAVVALSWIPIVNFLVMLYSIYLLYVFLQPTMKMDSNKAAVTVMGLAVLWLVVWALFGSVAMWRA
jgi:hypothetical protein